MVIAEWKFKKSYLCWVINEGKRIKIMSQQTLCHTILKMSSNARLDAAWAGERKMFSSNLQSNYVTVAQMLQAMIKSKRRGKAPQIPVCFWSIFLPVLKRRAIESDVSGHKGIAEELLKRARYPHNLKVQFYIQSKTNLFLCWVNWKGTNYFSSSKQSHVKNEG